jgi:hypothetical protein
LSSKTILTEINLRSITESRKICNINSNISISLNLYDTIISTELKRTKYRINTLYDDHQFEAIYYNGWNLSSLNQYINLLLGGTRKKMFVLIDENTIGNEPTNRK